MTGKTAQIKFYSPLKSGNKIQKQSIILKIPDFKGKNKKHKGLKELKSIRKSERINSISEVLKSKELVLKFMNNEVKYPQPEYERKFSKQFSRVLV